MQQRLLLLRQTSIDKNYGGIDKKSWTHETAQATFRHITAKVQAVGGADDRHTHIQTPVEGLPRELSAPDTPKRYSLHPADPLSCACPRAVTVRYRLHRNANPLHRDGCQGR